MRKIEKEEVSARISTIYDALFVFMASFHVSWGAWCSCVYICFRFHVVVVGVCASFLLFCLLSLLCCSTNCLFLFFFVILLSSSPASITSKNRITTYRPPTDHLPTTYRPPTNHLPTTYRPRTDHLTDHLRTTYRPLVQYFHRIILQVLCPSF